MTGLAREKPRRLRLPAPAGGATGAHGCAPEDGSG